MARNTQRTLALGPLRENQGGGMPLKEDWLLAPSGGAEGLYLLKLERREAIVSVV